MLQKILYFFLTRIIVGIAVIVGLIGFTEWFGHLLLDKTQLPDLTKIFVINCTEILLALFAYILLFRFYEKRKIEELK